MKNPLITIVCAIAWFLMLAGCASATNSDGVEAAGGQLIKKGDNVTVILSTDSCFEFGATRFTENCPILLQNVVNLLKPYGNVPVTVTGYTDTVTPAKQAHLLSRARAESVAAYLWAHGVPRQNLFAIGRGSECALANNATVAGSALNRRIEIVWRRG